MRITCKRLKIEESEILHFYLALYLSIFEKDRMHSWLNMCPHPPQPDCIILNVKQVDTSVDIVSPWQKRLEVDLNSQLTTILVEPDSTIVCNKNALNLDSSVKRRKVSISNLEAGDRWVNTDLSSIGIVVARDLYKERRVSEKIHLPKSGQTVTYLDNLDVNGDFLTVAAVEILGHFFWQFLHNVMALGVLLDLKLSNALDFLGGGHVE